MQYLDTITENMEQKKHGIRNAIIRGRKKKQMDFLEKDSATG